MSSARYALLALVGAAFAAFGIWALTSESDTERLQRERAAHTAYVNALAAESKARPEKKGPDGLDGPGKAAEFEFLRTMDPATRTIPYERLWEANELGQRMAAGRVAPTTTSAWSERGPNNIGGRTRALMWDPNTTDTFWAGGVSGGLWQTADITDAAEPWTKQNDLWDNLAVTAMAYDPTSTSTFYVATGEGFFNSDAVRGGGLFKSTNGGGSFTRLASTNPASNFAFTYINDVVVTPTGTVLLATRNRFSNLAAGILRSTNGGTSWSTVLSGNNGAVNAASDLKVDADGDIYAGMGVIGQTGSVWKSTDDGATWTQQALPFAGSGNANFSNNYQRTEVCTAPSDANTAYVTTQSANFLNVNHVFKTTNGGMTWSSVATPSPTNGQAWYDLICAVDPNNANRVYLGVAVRMYRSTNGGSSWTNVAGSTSITGSGLHPDHHAIAFRPGSSSEAVFAHDGGIDYTANANVSGATVPSYVNRNNGYNVTQYYGGDLSPTAGSNVLVGGTQDNATHQINNAAIGAAAVPSPLSCCDGGFTIIDQDDANFAIGQAQFGFSARSFDGGATFGGAAEGGDFFLGQNSDLFIAALAFDDREDLMFSTLDPGGIVLGSNIKNTNVIPTLSGVGIPGMTGLASTFAASPFATPGTSTVLIGTNGGQVIRVVGIEPGGAGAVTDISGTINAGNISSIEFGEDEDHLLVAVSNYGVNSVYESTDGGVSWIDKDSASLPDIPIRWATFNPNNYDQVLLATESGLWETANFSNANPTWSRVPGFPTVRVDQLQYRVSDEAVAAITHGRGIWTATWAPPASATYADNATGGENWRMVASPVPTATLDDLLGGMWTQGFTGADTESGSPNVLRYDESVAGDAGQGFTAPASQSEVMGAARGYIVYLFSDDDFDGTAEGFPKSLSVTGVTGTGTVTPAVSYTDNGPTNDDEGWQLYGNPFDEAVDWDAFARSGFDATVQVWDPNTSSYRVWDGTVGTLTDGVIAPFQGFFARAQSGAATFSIPEAAKASGGTFYGITTGDAPNEASVRGDDGTLALTLDTPAGQAQAWVRFREEGTRGIDGFDAPTLGPLAWTYALLYTEAPERESATAVGLTINALPTVTSESADVVVPLGLEVLADGRPSSGTFTLAWPSVPALPDGWSLTLTDQATGEVIDMQAQDQYAFVWEPGPAARSRDVDALVPEGLRSVVARVQAADRFVLRAGQGVVVGTDDAAAPGVPDVLTLESNYPNPFTQSTTIRFGLPVSSEVRLEVYDLLGRRVVTLVDETRAAGWHEVDLERASLASGTYIYRIEAAGETRSKQMARVR
ncbi:MAG: T9SS type A sorting domain-containing protein [Bacteroidota bacterium]